MRSHLAAATALAALALVPSAASASSLTYEGDAIVVRAASGEANWVTVSGGDPGKVAISDSGGTFTFPADRCTQISSDFPAQCDVPGSIRVELGDGADQGFVMHDAPAIPITYDGGSGADRIKNVRAAGITMLGGDGADELTSEDGADILRGGEGDDKLMAGAGDDQLYGDGGDDYLQPDQYKDGNDVVDGGAGTDTLDDWADNTSEKRGKRITLTMDGQANDGRPGERDNVVSVESVKAFAPGDYSMSDGPDRVELYPPSDLGASAASGLGGDDVILAGNGEQTLDGGAGNDRLEGGFGNDTITGGPGRDTIAADFTGSQCGVLQSCTIPYGDDVVYARDGEADTIDCGVGTDRAVVDAIDTVTNCETVEKAGGAGGQAGQTGSSPSATKASPVKLAKVVKLRAALRKGLKVQLTGLPARKKVAVVATTGARVVATGQAKGSAKGTATVTLKFTKAAKKSLARKKKVTITITAGKVSGKVTLTR